MIDKKNRLIFNIYWIYISSGVMIISHLFSKTTIVSDSNAGWQQCSTISFHHLIDFIDFIDPPF